MFLLSVELDQSNKRYQELSTNLQHTKESLDKEVGKWKMLYDSLYNQYDNELHTWEANLSKLETQRDERETTYAEETRRKDRVVSDLSDQLKESEDRIQELQIELEACKVIFCYFQGCVRRLQLRRQLFHLYAAFKDCKSFQSCSKTILAIKLTFDFV